jgi:polysaccharide chain length determinant protein (PEP-CTERM system associated)
MTDDYESKPNQEEDSGILSYLPAIIWQRRWWLLVPLIACSVIGVAAAFILPTRYESTATLLVETPQLQTDLLGSSSDANPIERRIAKVREQLLTRTTLVQIIELNNLYAAERQKLPLSEVVKKMREATSISPVSADIGSGAKGSNTIAFSISFTYSEPFQAQAVAQEYVSRLVKLDTAQTTEQAAGTAEFLQGQSNNLSGQIAEIENRIQQIKLSNGAALSSSGMMMMPSSGGYQAQIAGLQRENAQLAAQARQQSNATERDPVVVAAEAQLAGARAVYADGHPDVKLAEARLAEARKFAAKNQTRNDISSEIQRQIASNNAAIASLSAAQSSEQARAGAVMSAQARAPAVNEQVAQLQARADGLRANYEKIQTELINARGSVKMSEQQKGERLSVIDPPVVADQPSWPNRPLVMVGGVAGGVGIGLALILLLELLTRPIRGVGALTEITGAPPLVVVPSLKGAKRPIRWPWRRQTSQT